MAKWTVLQYFIILLAINGLHGSVFNRENLGIISQLLRKDSRDPLIVVVDTSNKVTAIEDNNDDRNAASEIEFSGEDAINHDKVNENYDAVLYNVLRTSNVIVDDDDDNAYDRKEKKRKLIEKAIRERCQARVVCTEKCSAEENVLRKRYCQKSCKAVFDDLVKCPPPGNRKKKPQKPPPPKDSCGSDSCASKHSCGNDDCKKKDSCEANDSCKPKDSCEANDSCKPKDSCEANDSCKPKDSCEANDSCNPTTAKRPRTGKTCPPSWR